jgi:hypothetical protein
MQFFRDMNLARAILLLSVVGAAVLGWIGWRQSQLLQQLQQDNALRAPFVVQQVQQLALEHTRLARELSGDQWIQEANPDGYVYRCGDAVGMGNLKIHRHPDTSVSPGIVDQRTRIQPDDPKRTFDRYRIAQFLHRLEANSQRVRVTQAKLSLVDRPRRASEIPNDAWTYDIEITSRMRADS